MSKVKLLPVDRFLQTLEIVYREGLHLGYSEYIGRADDFAADLLLAKEYSLVLVDGFNCLRTFAAERMGIDETLLPGKLAIQQVETGRAKTP